jgi:hypothetical protein
MKELLKKYYGLDIEYGKDYQDGMVFFINGDYYYLCKNYLSMEDVDKSYELYRVLKLDSHAYFFTNFLNLEALMKELKKVGFKLHRRSKT